MEQGRGLMRVQSNSDMNRQEAAVRETERAARDAETAKNQVISGLSGYIAPLWDEAKRAKNLVRPRLLAALRQRRGEYEPTKLLAIKETGGSDIYMMITSVKCRAAASWLRDALLGQGHDKPWTISPTPHPALPDDAEDELAMAVGQEVGMMAAAGVSVPPDAVRERMDAAREALKRKLREVARVKAEDTERVLEDELVEGNYAQAMDEFVDDFVTYPAAILKGPVVHLAPVLSWKKEPGANGTPPRWVPIVENKLVKRWYRVDPFKFYPAGWSAAVEDGHTFEHHRITVEELFALIGAPGYDEAAIRAVINERSALTHWLNLDWYNSADRLNQPEPLISAEGPLDALEFYGAVPGKYLLEWGIKDPEVQDPEKSYNVNAWMIGRHVIKASVNPDPLGTKPYRKASYEEIPGAFWGNGIPDLVRDVQDVCNSAARSLVNNMAISSGPQVAVNTDRMAAGAKVTALYPWKIHQFTSDPMGSTAPPIEFFQPQSNAQELMGVFNHFSALADEYSGLPKYMSGDTNVGGAGRTASGLSSLMSNSNRLMKQVMSSIDRINQDVIGKLHQFLMMNEFDRYPELEGDIRIVVRGATSVMAREQLALRRNEFLQATANPIDMQVIGTDGRAYLLREQAKSLELDTDRIIGIQAAQPMAPQPGQPGVGAMPGQSGQGGSQPVVQPNMRPVGATMDRPKFATGGLILGPGTGTSDSVPIDASHGEYVLNADAVKKIGVDTLNHLNALGNQATDAWLGFKQDYPKSALALSVLPVTGQVTAAAELNDAYRRGDGADAALAAAQMIPFGGVVKGVRAASDAVKFARTGSAITAAAHTSEASRAAARGLAARMNAGAARSAGQAAGEAGQAGINVADYYGAMK